MCQVQEPLLGQSEGAMKYPSALVRFLNNVGPTGSGCWNWTAGTTPLRYGKFRVGGRITYAHRYSYEMAYGPIPEGLQLDHLCRNPSCVRPSHLEAVTCRENLMRGDTPAAKHAAKTHCPQGHEYNDTNTYMTPAGTRQCKPCTLIRQAAARAAKRIRVVGGET